MRLAFREYIDVLNVIISALSEVIKPLGVNVRGGPFIIMHRYLGAGLMAYMAKRNSSHFVLFITPWMSVTSRDPARRASWQPFLYQTKPATSPVV
jgi:hypothetical protein